MSNFFAASLGACLGIGLLLLIYRKCERRLDSGSWSWMFGAFVFGLLYYLALQVFPDLLFGHGDPSYGLIHVGFPVNPRPRLRELAAGWRPGPLEVLGWVWLIGFVLCLLGQLASLLRFWRRVDKESRPASERVQRALMDASRALKDGVLSEKAYEDGAREVVVMPSLSGPVSLVLGVRLLLLDREDYDDETLDAILRHELMHTSNREVSLGRLSTLFSLAVQWLNPAAWWMRSEQRRNEELACDMAAAGWRSLEHRRAYARAMVGLASGPRREVPGTAGMACGAKTLRRRVAAILRGEPEQYGVKPWLLRTLLGLVTVLAVACGALLLGGAGSFRIDEGNFLSCLGMDLGELSPTAVHESAVTYAGNGLYRLRVAGSPYGAEAVLSDGIGGLYLKFPAGMPEEEVEAGIARLEAQLTGALGEPLEEGALEAMWARLETQALEWLDDVNMAEWKLVALDDQLRQAYARQTGSAYDAQSVPPPLLLLLGASGEERGTWRGSTDDGTATVTLRVLPGAASRAPETEGGALVALVWDEWWPESA